MPFRSEKDLSNTSSHSLVPPKMLHKKSRSFCFDTDPRPKEDRKENLKPTGRETGRPPEGPPEALQIEGRTSELSPTSDDAKVILPDVVVELAPRPKPNLGPQIMVAAVFDFRTSCGSASSCGTNCSDSRGSMPSPATTAPMKSRKYLFADFNERHQERKSEIDRRRSFEHQLAVDTMDKHPSMLHTEKRERTKSRFFYESQCPFLLAAAAEPETEEEEALPVTPPSREDEPRVYREAGSGLPA